MVKKKEIILSVIIVSAVLLLFAAGLSHEDNAYSHLARRERVFSCMQSPASIEKESRKDAEKLRLLCGITGYTCTSQKDASGKACYTYRITYCMSASEEKEARKAEKRLAETAMKRPKKERAEYIYRHIITGVEKDTKNRLSYTPYGALILKKACCEGASLAFADVCSMAGIESRIVYGKSGKSNHMWTAVRSGCSWKYCDPIWDAGEKELQYFMRSKKYMQSHSHKFPD